MRNFFVIFFLFARKCGDLDRNTETIICHAQTIISNVIFHADQQINATNGIDDVCENTAYLVWIII